MKIKIIIFCLLLEFCLNLCFGHTQDTYRQVDTSLGKIVLGLDKEEALERFGPPSAVAQDTWYYSGPPSFFVHFPSKTFLSIYLLPTFCRTTTGVPLELKAYVQLPDSKLKDITSEVRFLFSQPQNFLWQNSGVFVPTKPGKYQIVAKYKEVLSTPSYIDVKGFLEKTKKEQLLNIDVLPFKPKIPPGSRLNFVAFGTFFDPSRGRYLIRDLSEQVSWFVQKDAVNNVPSKEIYFAQSGKFKVFCKFQDITSFSQEVEVREDALGLEKKLKHITILPEFVIIDLSAEIDQKAFGTYDNNAIEDITSMVNWRISDYEKITRLGAGKFLSKSVGIAEVTADLGNSESLPAKIIVTDRKDLKFFVSSFTKTKQDRTDSLEVYKSIKEKIEGLSEGLVERKNLSLIRVNPDFLKLSVGSSGQVNAVGIYDDKSQMELTLVGDWISSDNNKVKVSQGKITALSPGEAHVYLKFKGLLSQPAAVTVEGPKLVSIIVSPQESQISTKDKLSLKCEGVFSDSTRKDITESVGWKISDPGIIRIENGVATPLKIGQTLLRADYLKIESLAARVKVVKPKDWLVSIIIKIISFFMSAIIITFVVLYFLTAEETKRLRTLLNKEPKDLIISLYDNIKSILSIFGLRYKETVTPLDYARSVQDRYSIKDDLFVRLTSKFEETKYSRHILQPQDAVSVKNDYHNFLRILVSRHNKFSLFMKYCLTLVHRKPLFISRDKST